MANPRAYPLHVSEELAILLQSCRSYVSRNASVVTIFKDDIPFIIKDVNSDFTFHIIEASLQVKTSKTLINLSITPNSELSLNGALKTVYIEQVEDELNKWANLISRFSSVAFSQEEILLKEYERKYFVQLSLTDPGANDKPFEPEVQDSLFDYLQNVKEQLKTEYPDGDWKRIVEEINVLQSKLTKLTKNETLHGLSKIFSIARLMGVQVFKDYQYVSKKEAIKYTITEGVKYIPQIGSFFEKMLF